MRRLIGLLWTVLLLGSCVRPGSLSSDEVLRRASLAAQALSSAQFELRGDFALGGDRALQGTFRIPGVLQDQGKAFQVNVDLQGTLPGEGEQTSYSLKADLISLLHVETYLRLQSLSFDPPNSSLEAQFGLLRGVWWKIPSMSLKESPSITPDPRLLRLQSEVLTVTKDRGMDSIRGRDAYRYDVALDREKLIAFLRSTYAERGETFDENAVRASFGSIEATGEVWIDAETFVIHRIAWNIASMSREQASTLSTRFSVDFTEHGSAPSIEFPVGAQVLSPEFFLPLQEQLP